MAEKVAGGSGRSGDRGDGHVGRRWLFGSVVFDELKLELTVDGRAVEIEKKPLEVLEYLLHHAGEVVTKDELAEQIWPGRILTESVHSRCISALRSALGDQSRELIKTVHGYGYRLVAQITVEAARTATAPMFNFAAGDRPTLRPNWKLQEQLGSGSYGEAWLVQHESTGEKRVFKFARDQVGVAFLKREVTLGRVLRGSLGTSFAMAHILDWNLEVAPYFLETQYIAGRDLVTWAETLGGLKNIPMPVRLELVAQVAETLAAAHSVGVLHKDLKPSNVLVEPGESPKVHLCDFGSGMIVDMRSLEKVGIARLGLTQPLELEGTHATPLYVSPEIISGQPATTKADVYSLGVMLYQVAAGDFRKPLVVGWELNIADRLLREDITEAAFGDPENRTLDACTLATRIRSLPLRHEKRRAADVERLRVEKELRSAAELRRMRRFAAALSALAICAISAGLVAYHERAKSLIATRTSKAVSGFLMEDVLHVQSTFVRPSGASYESLLTDAASKVDARLAEQPDAAAEVHLLLGQRFQQIGQFNAAVSEYERAVTVLTNIHGRASRETLMALDSLASAYVEVGRTADALRLADENVSLWLNHFERTSLAFLTVRSRRARILAAVGELSEAESELRSLLRAIPLASAANTQEAASLMSEWLGIIAPNRYAPGPLLQAYVRLLGGSILEELGGDYQEAESITRESFRTFTDQLGRDHETTAFALISLADILALRGKYAEAEQASLQTQEYFAKKLPPGHYARALPVLILGRLRHEQRRFDQAAALFREALNLCGADARCPPRFSSELHADLGAAYAEQGSTTAAIAELKIALTLQRQFWSVDNPLFLRIGIQLVDTLRQANRKVEAIALLSELPAGSARLLKSTPRARADLRRVEGLLAQSRAEAIHSLQESVDIQSQRLGPTHWRTLRVSNELAQVKASSSGR